MYWITWRRGRRSASPPPSDPGGANRRGFPRQTRVAPGRRRLIIAVPLALATLAAPARGGAAMPAPAATIESFYSTLLAVMKEGRRVPFDQRYQQLRPAIERAFNLVLMTRIAVGPQWTEFTPDQQQRLETAFSRYTIATYTNRFDSYSGERFAVDPNPVANPNGTIIKTRLIPADGPPISLNYLMRQGAGGQWQVIDVYLSGTISELATRRAEFASVLRQQGPEGLVRLLDQRAAALRTG